MPGLRDARGPLSVGYLWILAVWVVIGTPIPTAALWNGSSFHSLALVYSYIGKGVCLGIFTAITYMFGSFIFVSPQSIIGRALALRMRQISATQEAELLEFVQVTAQEALDNATKP